MFRFRYIQIGSSVYFDVLVSVRSACIEEASIAAPNVRSCAYDESSQMILLDSDGFRLFGVS
jgi:hypothetical protein